MSEWCWVEKRKYPSDTGGRIEARLVAVDPAGTWLFARAGAGNRHRLDGLLLLPVDSWWVAWWWADTDPMCTVDIVTPPRLEGSTWIYDDLEIDLAMRESDGVVHVVDLDEFAAAVTDVPYTAHLVEGAIQGMRDAERRMNVRQSPFDTGFDRLREALRLG